MPKPFSFDVFAQPVGRALPEAFAAPCMTCSHTEACARQAEARTSCSAWAAHLSGQPWTPSDRHPAPARYRAAISA